MIRRFVGCLSLFSVLSVPAFATENDPFEEQFTLTVGAYKVFRYDSTALLASREFGVGLAFSPEDLLGLDSRQTVLRLEGAWHFRPSHALTFSWYDITSTNSLSIERDFEWVDEDGNAITIPVGASVGSKLDYDIVKLGYLWNFYDSEKVTLSAGAGLHRTDITLAIDAETTSSGVNASRATTAVPLPVVSFALDYRVTPRFGWYVKTEVFVLSFDDWTGSYDDAMVGVEYRAWKGLGIGAALSSNSLRIVEEKPDTRFEFENRITGIMLFLRGHF